ncbi:GIY-YIG nuclease family protein [Agitococcus lubricus]|uniref:Putative endonuclease n=1 Tax=Agitococcus lubricus TaxID=1077255 RepID=A0A2T5IYB1_9GAMM|nr:GIY-YIG nuclease family protein [Agitococcus lubricus]PTQ88994.1 putative endonuclease [Agitococcus lubricus]
MWFCYMVRCADNSLYTGITTQLERRLTQHNGLLAGGARYTQSRRPVTLVYVESHADRRLASQREYQLKQLSKSSKETLVQQAKLALKR